MTTKTRDRRQSDRVTIWTPVQISAADGSAPASLKNLSVAGLCCTTARAFPEMTLVKILLDLPAAAGDDAEHVRLELSGAVVRCEPLRHGTGKRRFEVALYFTDLTAKSKASLMEHVRQRLS